MIELCCMWLMQVLVRLHAGGHKVLLFCTMTRLLDVLEEYLDWRGFSHLRLDGSTTAQDRADAVNNFNDPSKWVPLGQLRAVRNSRICSGHDWRVKGSLIAQ